MNKLTGLLGGIFAFFLLSWLGLVAVPFIQMGSLQAEVDADTGDVYPIEPGGMSAQGRQVYVANGCVNCHTQQVRPGHAGTDIARKWGTRQTVARDYLYEDPLLVGSMRIGPDLANVGKRYPDPKVLYKKLYMPRLEVPESIMPPYPFLFEKREITGQRLADALDLTGEHAPPKGYEIVPTQDARALVAYLMSLNRTHPLPESIQEAKEEEPAEEEKPAEAAPAASPAAEETPAVSPAEAPAAASPAPGASGFLRHFVTFAGNRA